MRRTLLQHLAAGSVSTGLLGAAIRAGGAGAREMWQDIVKLAFAAFKDVDFGSGDEALQRQLGALAGLTAEPAVLKVIAQMLLHEVVDLNKQKAQAVATGANFGRGWEQASLLGPLLSATAYADPLQVEVAAHRGLPVDGSLPKALLEARGYPASRRELFVLRSLM